MRCNMGHILEYACIYISYERVQGMVENTAYMFLTICFILGSTVHGILQARIVEWVVIPFSRGSS